MDKVEIVEVDRKSGQTNKYSNATSYELELEYKRIVEMSGIKKGRAYWKGYLAALLFAIDIINKK